MQGCSCRKVRWYAHIVQKVVPTAALLCDITQHHVPQRAFFWNIATFPIVFFLSIAIYTIYWLAIPKTTTETWKQSNQTKWLPHVITYAPASYLPSSLFLSLHKHTAFIVK